MVEIVIKDSGVKEKEVWNGFHFSMGGFVVTNGNRLAVGKIDPVTKEVKTWTEIVYE